MTKTVVVNLQNEPYEVYIGRDENDEPTGFGNPFKIGESGSRDNVLDMYTHYFIGRLRADSVFKQKIEALRGKKLGCYCKPKSCHGDVIADYLNSLPDEETG
jgi:hypothetical protein